MSEGFTVKQRGEQLGVDGKEGRVFETRLRKRFRATVLNHSVNMSRGTRLAVKQFKRTKSSNRILREAEFQQQAAAVGVAPVIVGVHLDDKYIVMERADALIIDLYRGQELPDALQYMICALMARLDAAGILHNDGNARNLMVRKNKPVLVDYGFAKTLKRHKSNMNITLWGLVRSLKRHRVGVRLLDACVGAGDRGSFIRQGERLL